MEKRLPKISIVTPSYNQSRFIEKTIESVLSQNYPNIEYIIMDGGSTDGTVKILKKYERKLVWFSEKDKGQSDAINKGFRKTQGDIIGFINSDDLLEKGCLNTIGDFFYNRPDAFWVTGKCRMIDEKGLEIRKSITSYKNLFLTYCRFYKSLLVVNYISQPPTFMRKKVFEKVGGLDEKLHYSMDYEYWLRIWRKYPPHFINEYLAEYRIHSDSKGGKSPVSQFDSEYEIAKRYTRSSLILFLHRFHKDLAIFVYSKLNNDKKL